ncbi:branched-chain amino acid ABC transporter permease [Glaciimonas immobilis]|uniref:Branched-chain amino acid transport system permease protein n=1 Tax=Glaciimonas immobilis TaxID=728004 RepID=A0A840RTK6_9BURK|nr:branched-chain amino acid ABC transporter permease [Glaciimonas immobilis]KAF3996488.1 branched-chain amino acid ABC transporter permease [Glaciimonas immobilis]MBB5201155.1 branched-chain amino acid transport system permease protein [Glaciimonas immobilis]
MDIVALTACVSSASCLLTQGFNAFVIGMLLFLVASGLTLIFGVLKVVNFTHGSLYMLGAYFAFYVYGLTNSYLLAILAGMVGVALFGVLLERIFFRRLYQSNFLMQLLMCYGWILVLDDVVQIVFGAEFQSMDMPPIFARAPIMVAGAPIPIFYIFLISISFIVALAVWLLIVKTAFGSKVRAVAANPSMTAALGINTSLLYAGVFALGAGLAGLAGALAAPVRSLVPGMGFSILIESFIVTVIGGMGSIGGALVAAILIGLCRSFGSVGFPMFTDILVFALMAVVLVLRPDGLFGKAAQT